MSFISDFKQFAMKGNIIDMAVGVIVGGAFGKIVSSLVNDIIMPVISIVTGGDGLANFKYVITPGRRRRRPRRDQGSGRELRRVHPEHSRLPDHRLQHIRGSARDHEIQKQEQAAPAPAPAPSKEEVLLTEIRDLLKEKK